jgi:hypothetical protein
LITNLNVLHVLLNMAQQSYSFKITGIAPLIVHNGELADPFYAFSQEIKKISGKRKKTEADHEMMAKLEWRGGLYVNEGKLIVPSDCFEASLVGAAKLSRLGKDAARGLFVEDHLLIEGDGVPESVDEAALDEMYDSRKFVFRKGVRVGTAKVMRTRPIFGTGWSARATIVFNDAVFNKQQIEDLAESAGSQIGLCEWRPRYGRFAVSEGVFS